MNSVSLYNVIYGEFHLNKNKKPVPAGRFNAGQKTWFWLATLGGVVMIGTGAAMYFQDFRLDMEISIYLRGAWILKKKALKELI